MNKDPVPEDFEVIDETPELLLVAKPARLLVHPTRPDGEPTLWHGLRALLAYELANGGQISIINRLDRETSGLTLVAKTSAAARRVGRAMMRRELAKEYLAIIAGTPTSQRFTVDAPLCREGDVRHSPIHVRQCVHDSGRPSRTEFQVVRGFLRRGREFSLVRAIPVTGRMHQIRVHLAHCGHPIVGDKLYMHDGGEYLSFIETGWTPALQERLLFDRHALHSAALSIDGQRWDCPLPADMSAWMNNG